MKKHLFIIAASLIAGCVSLGCQNDSTENTPSTKSASGQDIPSYLNVVSELKAGGCTEINLNDTDLDFSEMLTPGYKEYAVFFNGKENRYVIPVRYDPADEEILYKASEVCDKKLTSFTITDNGITCTYYECSDTGDRCRLEVVKTSDGHETIAIIICT